MICGRLDGYWETGTEGIRWSVIDPRLPGHDGLWMLEDGDHLKVIDFDGNFVWEGEIRLEYDRCRDAPDQQHLQGFWINGLQTDLEPDAWGNMFFLHLRGILQPRRSRRSTQRHPFLQPSAMMSQTLATIDPTEQQRLYRDTLYAWLHFDSQGKPYSHAINQWGFTLAETRRLIGSPTDEQIAAWMTFPKKSTDVLMPFSLERLVHIALLQGVYAGLDWKFAVKDDIVAWLTAGSPSVKYLMLNHAEAIATLRDLLTLHLPSTI